MDFKQFFYVAMWMALVDSTYNFFYDLFTINFDDNLELIGLPFTNFVGIPIGYAISVSFAWSAYRVYVALRKK
ncbi:MAG: hypothetical protein JKY55_16985 [Aliivibrio sp.]|uniref:hypothetical protein n=1 Tax=Aliivibrio sp. TaxID=1872443 RepID=UPI001A36D5F7|nr:hypothetical protein [Aliivibrio sp.]